MAVEPVAMTGELGDLIQVEFRLGESIQSLTHGMVMDVGMERDSVVVTVIATLLPQAEVQFDTIAIPAEELCPGSDEILIDHGMTTIELGEAFEFEGWFLLDPQ